MSSKASLSCKFVQDLSHQRQRRTPGGINRKLELVVNENLLMGDAFSEFTFQTAAVDSKATRGVRRRLGEEYELTQESK